MSVPNIDALTLNLQMVQNKIKFDAKLIYMYLLPFMPISLRQKIGSPIHLDLKVIK